MGDVGEFLGYLLESLDNIEISSRHFNHESALPHSYHSQPRSLEDIRVGTLVNIRCSTVGCHSGPSTKVEYETRLQLPLPEKASSTTLRHLLEARFSRQDIMRNCTHDLAHSAAYRFESLMNIPRLLIVQYGRAEDNAHTVIPTEMELDLWDYLSRDTQTAYGKTGGREQAKMYLIGVIRHLGERGSSEYFSVIDVWCDMILKA